MRRERARRRRERESAEAACFVFALFFASCSPLFSNPRAFLFLPFFFFLSPPRFLFHFFSPHLRCGCASTRGAPTSARKTRTLEMRLMVEGMKSCFFVVGNSDDGKIDEREKKRKKERSEKKQPRRKTDIDLARLPFFFFGTGKKRAGFSLQPPSLHSSSSPPHFLHHLHLHHHLHHHLLLSSSSRPFSAPARKPSPPAAPSCPSRS